MDKEKILKLFKEFKKTYNEKKSKEIWEKQSAKVRKFWKKYILNEKNKLVNSLLDPILIIFDNKARGAGPQSGIESVGFPYIFQDMWYEIFRDIKTNRKLRNLFTKLFDCKKDKKEIEILNEIYKTNTKKNGLTGYNANAINDLMFVFNPERNTSILSLQHRYDIIDFFSIGNSEQIDNLTYGERIILTRNKIIEVKDVIKAEIDNRGWSRFFYWKPMKELWQPKKEVTKHIEHITPKTPHAKLINLLSEFGEIFGFESFKTPSVNVLRGKEFIKNKTLDLAWKVAGVAWIPFEIQMHGSIPDLLHRFQLVNQSSLKLVVVVDESEHEHIKEAGAEYLFKEKLITISPAEVEEAAKDYKSLLELRNKIFS